LDLAPRCRKNQASGQAALSLALSALASSRRQEKVADIFTYLSEHGDRDRLPASAFAVSRLRLRRRPASHHKAPALYIGPKANAAPPAWIRDLLISTSAGVSFAHGSNDGQKGMGLIMLILIGTVPTASP
jgi:phosphate/sulfate permease